MTFKAKSIGVFFFFVVVVVGFLEAAFRVGVKTKRPITNPVCIRETPVRGVRSLAPQTKGTALLS